MKLHYFDQDYADVDDINLKMAVAQGYIPSTCLLSGIVVMTLITDGKDPCKGCECDRTKCFGRDK